MKASGRAIDLVKKFEGFSAYPYLCPAGKRTIGYGHVIDRKYWDIANTNSPISEDEAEEILKRDIRGVESTINSSVVVSLKQGQFDALTSLIFNWGAFNFKVSNGFMKLNSGNYDGAAYEFFDKEGGVVKVNGKFSEGLYRRRQAELKLWQS